MLLEWLDFEFSVVKWTSQREMEDLGLYTFWSRTDDELSLVCPTGCLPKDIEEYENGWVAFRVVGKMDFSVVGILADISKCLAEIKISIFAISTFNTDYILIKREGVLLAQEALEANGWKFQNKKE
ncbi:ACT domain-containing protein [Anaerotignum sp. MB30-C6]|uniref:ACT domain-containing protein n=1 Tax=Anaerotignum sp. MB30-C6 TaxID=3070814 RepID=UPI0027DB5750|nr:ACT domain-containing protein [Anaerotignum sp. MB30-C6]WMI81019.1 ACT domain-containing protein [Anaerotignum sp. MB30-C6]